MLDNEAIGYNNNIPIKSNNKTKPMISAKAGFIIPLGGNNNFSDLVGVINPIIAYDPEIYADLSFFIGRSGGNRTHVFLD